MKITGTMIHYYFVCNRKLWFFLKDINFEEYNIDVKLGKLIDDSSYDRYKKNLLIKENINIDFIDNWKIIHEVKKSDKLEEYFIWQIKYYIYVLMKNGINIKKGILDYPELRKRTEVYLDKSDEAKLDQVINNINSIYKYKNPPQRIKKPYCKKCAYYEFCFI